MPGSVAVKGNGSTRYVSTLERSCAFGEVTTTVMPDVCFAFSADISSPAASFGWITMNVNFPMASSAMSSPTHREPRAGSSRSTASTRVAKKSNKIKERIVR